MLRYFFHIRDGWVSIPDEEGMLFATLDLAEAEAYASAHDLAAAGLTEGRAIAAYAVEVSNEAGTVLRRVRVESNRLAS